MYYIVSICQNFYKASWIAMLFIEYLTDVQRATEQTQVAINLITKLTSKDSGYDQLEFLLINS